jgi:hypothetical protein
MVKLIDLLKESLNENNIVVRASDYHWNDRSLNKTPSGYYPGVYFYWGPDAEEIAKSNFKKYKNIYKLDITGAKLYDLNSPDKAKELKDDASKNDFFVSSASGYGEVEYLKSVGYDGIKRGKEVIIFNPEKFKEID